MFPVSFLAFLVDVDREDVCDMILDKNSAKAFESAVDQQVTCLDLSLCSYHVFQYWYELFLDDLPMWGMVGEVLRDDNHGRMEKVESVFVLTF
jgi:hypothetical protein